MEAKRTQDDKPWRLSSNDVMWNASCARAAQSNDGAYYDSCGNDAADTAPSANETKMPTSCAT